MAHAVSWQRVEGGLVFAAALVLYGQWGDLIPWWGALLIFFAPDLSFLGYLLGPKMGAAIYNAVHIYGFGAALIALGLLTSVPLISALGALWLAHSGFDRVFGYGLKSPEGFTVTHLGPIGKGR